LFRWLVLIGLLIGEVLLLTLRFDTGSLEAESGWWVVLLSKSPLLLQIVIAVTSATLLLGGATLWAEARLLSVPPVSIRSSGLPLLGHLAAFVAFAKVTALVLEGDGALTFKPLWTIAWIVLGLAVVGLWALTVFPVRLWVQFLERTRLILLAGFVVGGLAWGAGRLLQSCWQPLAEGTLGIVRLLLGLVYSDVVCNPDERFVGTSNFAVTVAPECSGYEGIGLLTVFVAAYLWIFRRELRFPHALLLWPAGAVILWLGNSLRIAALIGIGTSGFPDVALGGFHSQAGWLAFNAVALGLAVAARRLRFFMAESVREARNIEDMRPARDMVALEPAPHPATAYLGPFLAILATTMLGAAITSGFDLLYPLRVLAAASVLWWCRRAYAELRWSWSLRPFAIGTAVFVVWIALVPSGIGEPSSLRDGLERLSPAWASVWLLFRIAGATITVPLAEELAFRGYLLRRLQSADWSELPPGQFSWMSLLFSSILFGLMHGSWFAGILAGLAYAFAVYRRGKLTDAVLAHATTNALLAVYVLATGAWALWS
jgi:exosortase E/protease (VPEID-CTERM system)